MIEELNSIRSLKTKTDICVCLCVNMCVCVCVCVHVFIYERVCVCVCEGVNGLLRGSTLIYMTIGPHLPKTVCLCVFVSHTQLVP